MPTYDYGCEDKHDFEVRCSISARPATTPCPHPGCTKLAKQIILTAPHTWLGLYILDYPGSKALKAGYVMSHGDHGVKKVSSGYGGSLNPSTRDLHPLAEAVQPERLAPGSQPQFAD